MRTVVKPVKVNKVFISSVFRLTSGTERRIVDPELKRFVVPPLHNMSEIGAI